MPAIRSNTPFPGSGTRELLTNLKRIQVFAKSVPPDRIVSQRSRSKDRHGPLPHPAPAIPRGKVRRTKRRCPAATPQSSPLQPTVSTSEAVSCHAFRTLARLGIWTSMIRAISRRWTKRPPRRLCTVTGRKSPRAKGSMRSSPTSPRMLLCGCEMTLAN